MGYPRLYLSARSADDITMGSDAQDSRVETPCDRAHLDQLRAPDSDIAVPSNPAALESIAALLAHRAYRTDHTQRPAA